MRKAEMQLAIGGMISSRFSAIFFSPHIFLIAIRLTFLLPHHTTCMTDTRYICRPGQLHISPTHVCGLLISTCHGH